MALLEVKTSYATYTDCAGLGEEPSVLYWDAENSGYSTTRGEKVKAFYKVLEQYGFQFLNDEEKNVVEGTSELYKKEKKDWAEDQR